MFISLGQNASAKKSAFRNALDHIPNELIQLGLLYSFVKSHMDERAVLNLGFDGAADDPLFSLVTNNDLDGLVRALKSDMQLLSRKKDGFTLLHVAADYCQKDMIRGKSCSTMLGWAGHTDGVPELVRSFSMHPDTLSDDGLTAIELAASTGSIDCVRLLISLGADIKPLADQELFTSVAMTGTRNTLESSPASGNYVLLSLLCKAAEGVSGQSNDWEAIQALLNGRYNVGEDEDEDSLPGSPLELAVSVLNYDSVIALLNLGTDPNAYNHMPPLHVAISLREPILALLLLTYGALPNLPNRTDGATPLHCADEVSMTAFTEAPRNDIIPWQHLVKTEVEAIDVDSDEAVRARVRACIAVLLHFGADLEARNSEGETAFEQAVRMGDNGTAEFLSTMGANIKAKGP
jgi:ankyrin repeat protein